MLCVLYVVATGSGFSLFVHFVCLFANKVSPSSHGYPGTPSVEETDLCLLAESWIKSMCHCCLKAMVVYLPQEKLIVAYCPLAPSLILSLLQSKFEENPWSRLASFSSGNPSILRRESEVRGGGRRGRFLCFCYPPSDKLLFGRQIAFSAASAHLGCVQGCARKPALLETVLFCTRIS